MPDRRPFPDTGPLEVDLISDSDWSKLTEPQRADLLRVRHHQVLDGQVRIWRRLDDQAATISTAVLTAQGLEQRLDKQVLPMLKENTDATKAAAESAEKVAKSFEQFAERAESLLDVWTHTQGFGKVVGWFGDTVRKLAWVAIPSAVAVGAWQALLAWLHAGAPGAK